MTLGFVLDIICILLLVYTIWCVYQARQLILHLQLCTILQEHLFRYGQESGIDDISENHHMDYFHQERTPFIDSIKRRLVQLTRMTNSCINSWKDNNAHITTQHRFASQFTQSPIPASTAVDDLQQLNCRRHHEDTQPNHVSTTDCSRDSTPSTLSSLASEATSTRDVPLLDDFQEIHRDEPTDAPDNDQTIPKTLMVSQHNVGLVSHNPSAPVFDTEEHVGDASINVSTEIDSNTTDFLTENGTADNIAADPVIKVKNENQESSSDDEDTEGAKLSEIALSARSSQTSRNSVEELPTENLNKCSSGSKNLVEEDEKREAGPDIELRKHEKESKDVAPESQLAEASIIKPHRGTLADFAQSVSCPTLCLSTRTTDDGIPTVDQQISSYSSKLDKPESNNGQQPTLRGIVEDRSMAEEEENSAAAGLELSTPERLQEHYQENAVTTEPDGPNIQQDATLSAAQESQTVPDRSSTSSLTEQDSVKTATDQEGTEGIADGSAANSPPNQGRKATALSWQQPSEVEKATEEIGSLSPTQQEDRQTEGHFNNHEPPRRDSQDVERADYDDDVTQAKGDNSKI